MSNIRLYLVDAESRAHSHVRLAIELFGDGRIELVGASEYAEQGLSEKVGLVGANFVLVDPILKEGASFDEVRRIAIYNGLGAISNIRSGSGHKIKILAWTQNPRFPRHRAKDSGADAFTWKRLTPQELVQLITRVHEGQNLNIGKLQLSELYVFLEPQVFQVVVSNPYSVPLEYQKSPFEYLPAQEFAVLCYLADERSRRLRDWLIKEDKDYRIVQEDIWRKYYDSAKQPFIISNGGLAKMRTTINTTIQCFLFEVDDLIVGPGGGNRTQHTRYYLNESIPHSSIKFNDTLSLAS